MKRIALPDGSIAEFPDEMPDSEIEGVLAREFSAPAAPQQRSLDDIRSGAPVAPGSLGQEGLELGSGARGLGQLAATMGSSFFAEPAAGLSGIGAAAVGGSEAGDAVVQSVRERFTRPLGPEGQQLVSGALEAIPDAVMNTMIAGARKYAGFADLAADALGPGVGAAVKTAPTALAELIGLKGARLIMTRSAKSATMNTKTFAKELSQAAPSIDELDAAAHVFFKEVDDAGFSLKAPAARLVATRINNTFESVAGRRPIARKRAGTVWREVENIRDASVNGTLEIDELLRAREALNDIPSTSKQARIAGAVREDLDEMIDGISSSHVTGGTRGINIGQKLRTAREAYRRARRAEAVNKAIEDGFQARSGPETGIRNEFGKLRRSKQFKFFTPEEKEFIKGVESGGFTANTFRKLGRFGFGEGSSSSIVGMASGAGLGFIFGGPTGAVVLPAIGMVSRPLAARLTRRNAEFALDIIKSGKDARRIVASYNRHTRSPNPTELAQLLIDPRIDLDAVRLPKGQPLVSEAVFTAMAARARIVQGLAAAGAGATASQSQGEQ